MKRVVLLSILMLLANFAHAGLYRYVDKEGNMHYSDSAPLDNDDVAVVKPLPEPVVDENMSYETRRAMENFPVTLYSQEGCGTVCDSARELLRKRGIPFSDKKLASKEDLDAFQKSSGGSLIPSATIGKTWLKGFNEAQWNSELDIAGYPKKDLTYRPPKPVTPPAQPVQ